MFSNRRTFPSTDIYGPGTFVDNDFLAVPDDAARVLKQLAKTTPGFNNDPDILESVKFEGHAEPMIPGPIKAPVVAAALHAMCGIVCNELLELRDGPKKREVVINTDQAALWLGSILTFAVNGSDPSALAHMGSNGVKSKLFPHNFEKGVFDTPLKLRTTAIYRTKTPGVWYQLHGSLNPDPVLEAIGVDTTSKCVTPEDAYRLIGEHVARYTADELEMIMVKNGFCGSVCYTPAEWGRTLMGKRLEKHPLINCIRQSQAIPTPPVSMPAVADKRPLAGVKVIELVRIVAGPVIGTTLAALGADVIRVNSSNLPDVNALQLTLNAGVRTIDLDLDNDNDRARLHELVQDADVFVQGFRPGSISRKGFGLDELLKIAGKRGKGIVYVEENAYGPDGPFYERRGWQQIGDAASGCSYVTGRSLGYTDGTSVLPPLPISDMTTGLVGALGALMALRDRARHGGSYHVLSSLVAADAISLHPEIGLYSPDVVQKIADAFQWDKMDPSHYVTDLLMVVYKGWKKVYPQYFTEDSPFMTTFEKTYWGRLQVLSPVVKLSDSAATPHWNSPPVPHCHFDRNISWR